MTKKKKVLLIVLSIILCLLIAGGVTTGVVFEGFVLNDTSFNEEPNLLKDAKYTALGKTSSKSNLAAEGAAEMEIQLKTVSKINTLAFYEPNNNVTDYEVYSGDTLIYKQQEMGGFRYATFPAVETDRLTVKVLSAVGSYNIKKIEGFYIQRPQNSFRIVSYVIADAVSEDTDWSAIKASTDVILIGQNRFDYTGQLVVNDAKIDYALAEVRRNTEGKDVNVLINFMESTAGAPIPEDKKDWPFNLCYVYSTAMSTYADVLRANLLGYVKEKGYDGIDFDYEYPQSDSDWSIFSDFLVSLKKNAPEGFIMSAATQLYGCNLSSSAWKALDYVNVMTYDGWDKFGNHSSFSQCVADAFFFYNQHLSVKRSKINLGLPFYSRPCQLTEAGDQPLQFWGDYKYEYELAKGQGKELSYWDNYTQVVDPVPQQYGWDKKPLPNVARAFNGPQMIKDKTALCYDYGAGGVMIWNYKSDISYDNEMSLYRAISDALS